MYQTGTPHVWSLATTRWITKGFPPGHNRKSTVAFVYREHPLTRGSLLGRQGRRNVAQKRLLSSTIGGRCIEERRVEAGKITTKALVRGSDGTIRLSQSRDLPVCTTFLLKAGEIRGRGFTFLNPAGKSKDLSPSGDFTIEISQLIKTNWYTPTTDTIPSPILPFKCTASSLRSFFLAEEEQELWQTELNGESLDSGLPGVPPYGQRWKERLLVTPASPEIPN